MIRRSDGLTPNWEGHRIVRELGYLTSNSVTEHLKLSAAGRIWEQGKRS